MGNFVGGFLFIQTKDWIKFFTYDLSSLICLERLLEAGARDASSRESLTPPSLNPAYKIDINHDDDLGDYFCLDS